MLIKSKTVPEYMLGERILTMTNYEDMYVYNKEPIIKYNNIPYVDIPYLIKLLRNMQNGRYSMTECEKEYVCIENIIDCINAQTSYLLED